MVVPGFRSEIRRLGSQCHIFHSLLVKASHKVNSDSIGREGDFTSWQEELQSQVKGMDARESEGLWVVLESVTTGCPLGVGSKAVLF